MTVSIHVATPADIPALQQLTADSVRHLSKGYYSEQQAESALVHVFGVDSQLIADETYFVARVGEALAGCGGWSKRKTLFGGDQTKKEADPLLNPQTEAGRIRAFFVHPQWARRGIGRQLIEACENAARRAGFSRLELGATLPGEPLYSALGYQIVEPITLHFPDGEELPLYKMQKQLV